jgi:SWIM zinc finger
VSADRVLIDDGRPVRLEAETRPGKGPWARLVASAIVPDERAPRAQRGLELARGGSLHTLSVGHGVVAARVSGSEEVDYEVELHSRPLPPRVWAAATKAPEWRKASQGHEQSVALEHELAAGWGEPLIPAGRAIRRTCTCPDVDFSGTCKHLVALAYVFSEAIDADPSLLLRWRGCLTAVDSPSAAAEPAAAGVAERPADDEPDPWLGGPVPEIGPARALPVGAVLKRLGPSGLRLDGVELIELLEPAYAAFTRVEPELVRHRPAR